MDDDLLTPMDLAEVQHQNVMAVNTEVQRSSQFPLSMEQVLKKYPGLFQGTGKMQGQHLLEIEENAKPVPLPLDEYL